MRTRHAAGRVYNYEYCVGQIATFFGKGFNAPMDFAMGSGESLYVVNRSTEFQISHGLNKFTLNHEFVWENRGNAYADGESPWPMSIDIDGDENLYISDDYVSKIFISDKDGNHLRSWGTKGSGEGELNSPSGLAFDGEENLYVVDALNHRVQKFTKDGEFLARWGRHGTEEGELNMPWGIAIDGQGDVYVADWKSDRVQKFSPDGDYLASFGSSGTGDGELRRPTGVAIDQEGDVYVTDWGNDRLNVYAPDGAFITEFLGDADVLSPWAQERIDSNPDYKKARRRADLTPERRFSRPIAVNVDDDGRIMVLDSQRGRVQIYVKERDFVDPPYFL